MPVEQLGESDGHSLGRLVGTVWWAPRICTADLVAGLVVIQACAAETTMIYGPIGARWRLLSLAARVGRIAVAMMSAWSLGE